MKRYLLIVFIITVFLEGCSLKRGGDAPRGDMGTPAAQKEKIVLWSYYETDEQQAGLEELVSEYNLSQERYEASWEYHGPVTEFNKQLAIAINEKQLPDMVIIDNPDMRNYVELGLFEDITPEMIKRKDITEYYPSVIGSVIYDNKYYGVPFCCNNVGLFYNKDLFREANIQPPRDWEEFKAAAKELTTGDRYGFAMSAISGEQSAFQILPWILSAGAGMDTLGGSETARAFGLMAELVEAGALSRDSINWSQNDVARKFIAGECVMMENGPWVLSALIKSGINYGMVRLPVDKKSVSVAGGENIGILKGKNKEGALSFIHFYYQDEIMLKISGQSNALPPKQKLAERLSETDLDYKVFVEQMETSISRSSYEFWPEVTKDLSEGLFQVITGEETPEEVSRNIKRQ